MNIVWSESQWLIPALVAFAFLTLAVILSYRLSRGAPLWVRLVAAGLKILGFAALVLFLLGPETVRSHAKPGTNLFAVIADTSASMQISDQTGNATRGDRLQALLTDAPWLRELEEQFSVQRFTFDARLRPAGTFDGLEFNGRHTSLAAALRQVAERYRGQPLAGILVLSDGSATDLPAPTLASAGLPPVHVAVLGPQKKLTDLAIEAVNTTATMFEDAPVVVDATIRTTGARGQIVTTRLLERDGTVVAEQTRTPTSDDETLAFRFTTRPDKPGTAFYRVETSLADPETEATLENNRTLTAVNRETGPYRVLYVGGNPNWEHKFLQRAVNQDNAIKMASLIRIAKREPKFDWRGRSGETTNPLYRGFGAGGEAERFDESVFIRLQTRDEKELRTGFPSTPEDLYGYEAVILDNLEAAFFSNDQMRLLQRFVSERGGSLVMLGGIDSLGEGGYAGTPIGETLPLYLNRPPSRGADLFAFQLTRDGLLQPWMRLRANEGAENERLAALPGIRVLNSGTEPKPGALVMADSGPPGGPSLPAIAVQRYGNGRTAAVPIGDFWRWGLRTPELQADLFKSWRQFLRWALTDVPKRAEIEIEPDPAAPDRTKIVRVRVRGQDFGPAQNAAVQLRVQSPDGTWSALDTQPDDAEAGTHTARISGSEPGPWLVEALTTDRVDGVTTRVTTGWASNPGADEFRKLTPDLPELQALVDTSAGSLPDPDDLERWVAELARSPLPVTETETIPLWHQAGWLAVAIGLFAGEWGLRRWKGLP